jgi:hypothetical protein
MTSTRDTRGFDMPLLTDTLVYTADVSVVVGREGKFEKEK